MTKAAPNAELYELLKRYGLSRESFDALRPDSYEHALAAHDLTALDQLYALLLTPALPLEAARQVAPPWPAATRRAGQPPSLGALSQIGTRLRSESVLNGLETVSRFVDGIRARLDGLPGASTSRVTDAVCTLIAQELIQEKLGGGKIAPQVRAVKILLQREDQQIEGRRLALLEARAAQAEQTEKVVGSNLSPAEQAERIRKIFKR